MDFSIDITSSSTMFVSRTARSGSSKKEISEVDSAVSQTISEISTDAGSEKNEISDEALVAPIAGVVSKSSTAVSGRLFMVILSSMIRKEPSCSSFFVTEEEIIFVLGTSSSTLSKNHIGGKFKRIKSVFGQQSQCSIL